MRPYNARVFRCTHLALLAASLAFASGAARADIALSANDAHTVLVNGAGNAAQNPPADTVSVIDLKSYPPRIIATIEAPASVAGPPSGVAIAADESWAIVASANKLDPAAQNGLGPDNKVSVIDLKSTPPKVVQSLTAGTGGNTVRMTPDEKLALVVNRGAGTISIFTVKDKRLEPAGTLDIGNPQSSPSGLVILPDGKRALLTRDGDHLINVLHINGTQVTIDPRPISSGLRPYTMDINKTGTLAAVGNMGRQNGDWDILQLIDLTANPIRTVTAITVPPSPEGVKFSPDGEFLAVSSQNGTNYRPNAAYKGTKGVLTLFAVSGTSLRKVTETEIGVWTQGLVFSRDGRTILSQSMTDREIEVFRFDGTTLTRGAPLKVNGGAASIGTSWP